MIWESLDTWIVITGALAALACALPGCFLLLRRQSMVGDAISHAALPGIVLAFLAAHALRQLGWLSDATYDASRQGLLLAGAVLVGLACAVGSQWVEKVGRVEASAALGVVFTSLFALGLLLLRLLSDQVDLDPDCVLYGTLENSILDFVRIGPWSCPRAAVSNAIAACVNVLVFTFFYKEFRIASFDPRLATAMGIPASLMHYLLMAITALTAVSVFESVGSILVIAMLIVPAATAYLLTDRLAWMLIGSAVIAVASAALGHLVVLYVPAWLFQALGYPQVADASTAGMMTLVAGMFFVAAVLLSPRYGVIARWLRHRALARRTLEEDVLGYMFRREERVPQEPAASVEQVASTLVRSMRTIRWVLHRLARRGHVRRAAHGWRLTDQGRAEASAVVRAHRLWESYLAEKVVLEPSTLHQSAERVEHFLSPELRQELSAELSAPTQDPHGAEIPHEP